MQEEREILIDAFNVAVADMRRMFPQETSAITFVHTIEEGWREKITTWLESIDPDFKEKVIESWAHEERRNRQLETLAGAFPASAGANKTTLELAFDGTKRASGFAVQDPVTRLGLVVAGADDTSLFSISPRTETEMIVYHETGHLIAPLGYFHGKDALLETDYPRYALIRQAEEISADSFAVLCGIQTGSFDREDAIALSLNRSLEYFFSGKTHHLTSLALDRLLLKEDDARIMSLTPAEIKAVVEKHAALNECSANDHSLHDDGFSYPCAKTHFYQSDAMPMPEKLGERFAAFAKWGHEYNKPAQPAYYIADKILRHVAKVGAVFYPESLKISTEGPDWDKIRARLADRPSAFKTRMEQWQNEGPLPETNHKIFLQRIFSSKNG